MIDTATAYANEGGVGDAIRDVDGSSSTQVKAGEDVRILITADSPDRGLPIATLATDLTGAGLLGDPIAVTPAPHVSIAQQSRFDRPGTYFIAAGVTAQGGLDAGVAVGRGHNIARADVTVTE
ncbi:hypothetical protein [Diaminobutyricibacter sp. McL0608]|uniref:hypothetical protein n=1 Tax=Leifsonia sp. McL0608 TaxID=3143537 RepID=UPI0031F2F024